MDSSDKTVPINVIAHVQAVIVSMAVVIRDVFQDGRDTIAMIEMSYQVFMSLIHCFNTMRFFQITDIFYLHVLVRIFNKKTLMNVKPTVWMIYMNTVLVHS